MTHGVDSFPGGLIPAHYPGQPPDSNHYGGDLAADQFPLTAKTTVQTSQLPTYQSSLSQRDLQSIQSTRFINDVGGLTTPVENFLRIKMDHHARNGRMLQLSDDQLEDFGNIHLDQLHGVLQQKHADKESATGWWQRRKIGIDITKLEKKIKKNSHQMGYDIATALRIEHDPFKKIRRLERRNRILSALFDHDGYNSTIQTNNLVSVPSIMPSFGMGMAPPFPMMMMGSMDFGMSPMYMPMFPPMMSSLTQTQQFINIPSSYTSYTPPSYEYANKANYYASLAQYQSVVTLDDSEDLTKMGEAAAQSNPQKMQVKKPSKTNKKAENNNFENQINQYFSYFTNIVNATLKQIEPADSASDDQKKRWNTLANSLLAAADISEKQFIKNYASVSKNMQQLVQQAIDDCIQSVDVCAGQDFTQADAADKENHLYGMHSMLRPRLELLKAFADNPPKMSLVLRALEYEANKTDDEEAFLALHDALNRSNASDKTNNINKLMNWKNCHGYDIMRAIFNKPDNEQINVAYSEMQGHLDIFQQALHGFTATPRTKDINEVLRAFKPLHVFVQQLLLPPAELEESKA